MLGKLGIFITILVLVLLFYLVIAFGAGAFSKGKLKPETKKLLERYNFSNKESNYFSTFE